MPRTFYVYILASRTRTLYTGISNDLARRLQEHRNRMAPSFTARYAVYRLVYLESTDDPTAAIAREKQIKRWRRDKKIALIEAHNPEWKDLSAREA